MDSDQRQTSEGSTKPARRSPIVLTCIVSSFGIGLLGLGVGAMAAPYLANTAVLFALLGLTVHLIALTHSVRRKRREISGGQLWITAIYFSCWTILIGLASSVLRAWFG